MKKFYKSFVVVLTVFILSIGMLPPTVKAQEFGGDAEITNHVVTKDKESFTITVDDEAVDYKSVKTEDSFKIETVEENNEVHTFTYSKGDDFMIIDGEKVAVEIDTRVENNMVGSTPKLLKASAWDAKYISTGSVKISKTVKSIGTLVGVIGGVISIAALTGVTIATSAIASTVGNWASVVGLGTISAGYLFNGKIQFKQYRTKGLVPTGYGKSQYAFRFQDVRVIGTIKGKKIDKQLKSIGRWYFSSKPY